jgi:arginine transport system substrate-binding protein
VIHAIYNLLFLTFNEGIFPMLMRKSYFIPFILCVAVLTSIAMFLFRSRSAQHSSDTLTVGMMSGWAPFMTINEQGAYEGFDVDVANEIGQRMNKKVVITDLGSLSACFIALDRGKIDLLLSGLDITQTRKEQLNMIRYTGADVPALKLVFWNAVPAGIEKLEDLQTVPNALVIAEPGSAQEKYLDQFPTITKKSLTSISDMLLDIKFGKSTAILLEPRVATRLASQNPELKLITVNLPAQFQLYGCGIAIKKENSALAQAIEAIVAAMHEDGTLKKLEVKWQLEE